MSGRQCNYHESFNAKFDILLKKNNYPDECHRYFNTKCKQCTGQFNKLNNYTNICTYRITSFLDSNFEQMTISETMSRVTKFTLYIEC